MPGVILPAPFPALPGERVDARGKGMPDGADGIALADVGRQGWNVLRGDLPTPLAVLDGDAIAANGRWIAAVTDHYGVSLAPHGKTTMAPQLFRRQIADGAWGITLSTRHHVQVARHYGIPRVFLANQILDRGFLDYIARIQIADPGFDFYFLVDSPEGVALLAEVADRHPGHRPFRVLIELGAPASRAGCRTLAEARVLARALAAMSGAAVLVGIEGFEGSLRGADGAAIERRVGEFLAFMAETAAAFDREGLFGGAEVLLTAGGSTYFDLVAKALRGVRLRGPARVVLRSGCYIAHDAGMYAEAVARVLERSPELAALEARPRQALTVWATLQSRPAPDLALLNAGRRDLSHDSLPPRPLRYATGAGIRALHALPEGHAVTMLNDQHAYLACPPGSPLRPGDLVELGISHPCTTFDKWDVLCVVDRHLDVVDAIRPFF
ncbi:MAG: hypothetical protein IT545_06405 [Rhodobacteraceae bacterium]|nr:hypothetical protein [Paracoccaceae bacterium]